MGDRAIDARLVPLVPTDNETIGIDFPDPMSIVNYTYLMEREDDGPMRQPHYKSALKCKYKNYRNVLVTIKEAFYQNTKGLSIRLVCPCCCKPCRERDDCSKCVGEHTIEKCSHARKFGEAFLLGEKWKGCHTNWDKKLCHRDGTEMKPI